jgi:hypothetical protein
MARTNLSSMSVDELLKLRDEIGEVLQRKCTISSPGWVATSATGSGAAEAG